MSSNFQLELMIYRTLLSFLSTVGESMCPQISFDKSPTAATQNFIGRLSSNIKIAQPERNELSRVKNQRVLTNMQVEEQQL